jgi:hypothetical protein
MQYDAPMIYQQRHLSRILCSTMESMDVASVNNLEGIHEQRMVGQLGYSPIW